MLYAKDPQLKFARSSKSLQVEWDSKKGNGILSVIGGLTFGTAIYFMSLEPVREGVPRSEANILQLRVMMGIFVFGFVVYGLFQIFNKTKIIADKIEVRCHSTLLPFLFSKSVRADGILQVFVRPPKTKSFFGHLYAMDKNSHCTRLTSGMPSEIAAHQICHELQDFYGLEDLPVYGQNTLPHQPGPRKTV